MWLLILFGSSFCIAVALALGSMICGKGLTDWPVRFVSGAAILSSAIFVLCCLGLAYPVVFAGLGGMIVVAARPRLRRYRIKHYHILYVILIAYFILYLFNSMAPEASPDGSAYHLGLVARYLREHGFHRITWDMYANLSGGMEMLFLFAFAFGKHSAAALLHLAFLVALVCQMIAYSRRAGFPLLGICAGLLVFVSPVVGIDASSAYNDVALACIAFTLFYLLQVWDAERSTRLLMIIGLVAGFGYAVKYTAAPGVLYAAGFVYWKSRRSGGLRQASIVAACAALMILPWMAKNWLWVQNPVSPFFNNIFPNPYITVAFEAGFRQDLATYELPSRWMIPWAATTSGKLQGILGPIFLLAPIALFSLKRREGRQLLLAAGVFGITYFSNIGTRFLIVPLPFVALAMMLALGTSAFGRTAALALSLFHAVISWPSLVPKYAMPGGWALKAGLPIRAAMRLEPEGEYLKRRLVGYEIDQLIERVTEPDTTIFSYQTFPEAYTSRRILIDYESAENHSAGQTLWSGFADPWRPTLNTRFSFHSQPVRGIRVVETGSGSAQWRINELKAFDGDRAISRNGWQVTADPFPWGIEYAFDGAPVTFWECGNPMRSGMHVDVDFTAVRQVDSVVIESSPNQAGSRLQLLGQDPSGRWSQLASAPEISNLAAPKLRREATLELKHRGIGYVLLFDYDLAAADIAAHPDLWGVREAGQVNGAKLYQLQ